MRSLAFTLIISAHIYTTLLSPFDALLNILSAIRFQWFPVAQGLCSTSQIEVTGRRVSGRKDEYIGVSPSPRKLFPRKKSLNEEAKKNPTLLLDLVDRGGLAWPSSGKLQNVLLSNNYDTIQILYGEKDCQMWQKIIYKMREMQNSRHATISQMK